MALKDKFSFKAEGKKTKTIGVVLIVAGLIVAVVLALIVPDAVPFWAAILISCVLAGGGLFLYWRSEKEVNKREKKSKKSEQTFSELIELLVKTSFFCQMILPRRKQS